MKHISILAALLATAACGVAQEKLTREEALKYAFIACSNLKEMLDTPIPTDPDVKRPVAVRDEGYGGLVLPEARLSPETFSQASKDVIPLGQLWLVKLAPLSAGEVVPAEKLRKVHVSSGDHEADALLCALGLQKNSEGTLRLLVYGKGKEPVLQVPLKTISTKQENPIDISAERTDQGGEVTLRFVGKYEATFKVTDPDA
jgi:hypothetical protein